MAGSQQAFDIRDLDDMISTVVQSPAQPLIKDSPVRQSSSIHSRSLLFSTRHCFLLLQSSALEAQLSSDEQKTVVARRSHLEMIPIGSKSPTLAEIQYYQHDRRLAQLCS